jgi:hypothetical protein
MRLSGYVVFASELSWKVESSSAEIGASVNQSVTPLPSYKATAQCLKATAFPPMVAFATHLSAARAAGTERTRTTAVARR